MGSNWLNISGDDEDSDLSFEDYEDDEDYEYVYNDFNHDQFDEFDVDFDDYWILTPMLIIYRICIGKNINLRSSQFIFHNAKNSFVPNCLGCII